MSGQSVQFACTDRGQHRKCYPRVLFEVGVTRFRCGRCDRDVQLGDERFAEVLATLRDAGINQVDMSALA